MNILFYLSHPAQFHFAKNIISNLKRDGNNVVILIKTKDVLESLLKESGWDYINIQPKLRKNNKLSMALASFQRTFRVLNYAKKYKADMLVGTDASIAQTAWLLHKVSLTTLEDDAEIIPKLVKTTYPFTTDIVVPSVCGVGRWKNKKIAYQGYMKLAYLHPNYFQPDIEVVRKYIKEEKFCIIRLAKLTAHHDKGIGGLNLQQTLDMVKMLISAGIKPYVHSEVNLNDDLRKYQLNMASSDIHHIIAFATLLVSDSQSMSVEAAMLGTPSVRFSDFSGRISVLEELESKYQLTFGIKSTNSERLFEKIQELLSNEDLKKEFSARRQKMLDDKIDVTAFFTWYIEKYPQSKSEYLKQ
jgi:Uncharacterized protein conserved in archaea